MSVLDNLLLKVRNRRLVMTLAPLIGGVALGGLMVVKPALSKISSIQSKKTELSSKVSAFNDILAWEKKLSGFKDRLAPIEDKAKTIEELGTMATTAGLSVNSITPEEKKPVSTYVDRILVRIDAEGNYHQLGEFVSHVENMTNFTKVLSVNINNNLSGPSPSRFNKKTGEDSYKMSANVGLFYLHKDAS